MTSGAAGAARRGAVPARTGPSGHLPRAKEAIDRERRPFHHQAMPAASQLAPTPRTRRSGSGSPATALLAVAGVAWLMIAGGTAWLVFATPVLARIAALGSSGGSAAPVLGAVAWGIALTAPACFAVLGIARLGGAMQRARGAHHSMPPVTRRAALLPPACAVIPRIQLPDGRRIPDVVVGPHGVAFFERLPPLAAVRRTGERWEVRFSDRSWRSIENPLYQASRDGDRLRRHLEAQERDYVIRVQAAVIAGGHDVTRTDACAVVALDDVPAWLAALPAQRGMTPDRLARVREVLEALAA